MGSLRLGSPSIFCTNGLFRKYQRAEDAMTEEEVARFALQLREAERIRALIASEETALAHGGKDEPPSSDAVSRREHSAAHALTAAA